MSLTTPPAVSPANDWRFPQVTESRLDNGLRVLLYDCPGQYVAAASLLFDVALSDEPREKEGLAGLVARCLTEGSAGRSAEEFADALALCGADLDASASADGFAVRLAVPVSQLDAALGLMADAVIRPTFDEHEFSHERRLRLEEIEQARAYPQHVAGEQLNAALFGAARAARPAGGSKETVDNVERDDLVGYVTSSLSPQRATLIIAADLHGLSLSASVAAHFGEWPRSATSGSGGERAVAATASQLLLVDWPDAPQATIRMGAAGILRGDPRWPALFVANHAIGGTFASRINTVLREQKGVTYGASSALDSNRGGGLLTVSTAVRADAAAESVADIISILREASGGLSDEEVATGVRAATESAAPGFERADAVVSRVELLVAQGLPLDHVDLNLRRLREVTTESANAAYREIVRPDALSIVVVGSAAAQLSALGDLGYADVREVVVATART